jgi:hypothetical protein
MLLDSIPVVRGADPDPAPDQAPDPFIRKNSKTNLNSYYFVTYGGDL